MPSGWPHPDAAVGACAAVDQLLVGVHPLVGGAYLRRVLENAGDERPDRRELQRVVGSVEGVGLALEQAHVGVHRGARILGERLGHERRAHAITQGDF